MPPSETTPLATEPLLSDVRPEASKARESTDFHVRGLDGICSEYGLLSKEQGLSGLQAAANLKKYGENDLGTDKPTPFWVIYCRQLYQPLIIILFVLWALSIIKLNRDYTSKGYGTVKNFVSFFVVTFVILVVTIMSARGQYNTANALASLKEGGAAVAKVRRDGREADVEVTQIVPGDIVVLQTGDTVPADARVIFSEDLQTVEKTLTGEPHEKTKKLECDDPLDSFHANLVYASTAVVGGRGAAIVVSTGLGTEIGKIAAKLKSSKPPGSQLQSIMDTIGKVIIVFAISLIVAMVLFELFVNYCPEGLAAESCTTDTIVDAIFDALSVGTIMLPTTLLLMVTASLSKGAMNLAAMNARVTNINAVETIGACTVICSDKTGLHASPSP